MPRLYSGQEYARMVRCYYESQSNGEAAARLYAQRYAVDGGRRPTANTIHAAVRRAEEDGRLMPNLHLERERPVRNRLLPLVRLLLFNSRINFL